MLKVDVEGAEALATTLREFGPEAARLQQAIRSHLEDLAACAPELPEPQRSRFRQAIQELPTNVMDSFGTVGPRQRCDEIASEIDGQLEDARRFTGDGENMYEKALGFAGDKFDDSVEALGDAKDEAASAAHNGLPLSAGLLISEGRKILKEGMHRLRALPEEDRGRLRQLSKRVGREIAPVMEFANDHFTSVEVNARGKKTVKTPLANPGDTLKVLKKLDPNEVGIIQTGPKEYVVIVRGMDSKNLGANGVVGTADTYATNNSPLAKGTKLAMLDAIPPGCDVKLVGHSQGGMAVMDIAADERINARYNITHVETVGSPAQHKEPPANSNTKVLHIDNRSDEVPLLDEGARKSGGAHYTFDGSDDGAFALDQSAETRSQHDAGTYAKEMNSENFINSNEYQEFKEGDQQYCTTDEPEMSVYEIDTDEKNLPDGDDLLRALEQPLIR